MGGGRTRRGAGRARAVPRSASGPDRAAPARCGAWALADMLLDEALARVATGTSDAVARGLGKLERRLTAGPASIATADGRSVELRTLARNQCGGGL